MSTEAANAANVGDGDLFFFLACRIVVGSVLGLCFLLGAIGGALFIYARWRKRRDYTSLTNASINLTSVPMGATNT